jgi:hypothetical protein
LIHATPPCDICSYASLLPKYANSCTHNYESKSATKDFSRRIVSIFILMPSQLASRIVAVSKSLNPMLIARTDFLSAFWTWSS